MKRIDERDTMFARMNYEKGTPQYEEYYGRHKDKQAFDDDLRERPEICGEGTATYHPVHSPIAVANFKFLADIQKLSEGEPRPNKVEVDAEKMTERLKGLAAHYGAKLVGVAKLKPYHYYSHRGRQTASYGEEVGNLHPYGLVFAVEMEQSMMNRAPQVSEVIETSKGYVDAAIIGMQISYYIRELGYEARNHMDANYLVVAPLVAQEAGLGEIGRNGILITRDYGSRVRLGVVTTDIPLVSDAPKSFGLSKVCEACNRCVRTCPGKAIPSGGKEIIDGVERWQIKQEDCYKMWRSLGSDCGICISSCPFSQGVNGELLNELQHTGKGAKKILEDHDEKHGIRPYIKEPPEWLKG